MYKRKGSVGLRYGNRYHDLRSRRNVQKNRGYLGLRYRSRYHNLLRRTECTIYLTTDTSALHVYGDDGSKSLHKPRSTFQFMHNAQPTSHPQAPAPFLLHKIPLSDTPDPKTNKLIKRLISTSSFPPIRVAEKREFEMEEARC